MYCMHCGTACPVGVNRCPSCGRVVRIGRYWLLIPAGFGLAMTAFRILGGLSIGLSISAGLVLALSVCLFGQLVTTPPYPFSAASWRQTWKKDLAGLYLMTVAIVTGMWPEGMEPGDSILEPSLYYFILFPAGLAALGLPLRLFGFRSRAVHYCNSCNAPIAYKALYCGMCGTPSGASGRP